MYFTYNIYMCCQSSPRAFDTFAEAIAAIEYNVFFWLLVGFVLILKGGEGDGWGSRWGLLGWSVYVFVSRDL